MSQSDFMSLQPWIKHINNMVNSLNILQKCCGEQGFCRRRRRFPNVTTHSSYFRMSSRNFFWVSTTSGVSYLSWCIPLLTSLHLYPSFFNQLMTVLSLMLPFFSENSSAGRITWFKCWYSSRGVMTPRFCAARYVQTLWTIASLSSSVYWPHLAPWFESGRCLCQRR